MVLNPLSAWANVPTNELIKAIEQAHILESGNQVMATQSGTDLQVRTYLNSRSDDKDRDAKIDAMLIAREVMKMDPSIARVRVCFYERNLSGYMQITVTASDVAAFGSGSISKDKLFATLDVQRGSRDDRNSHPRFTNPMNFHNPGKQPSQAYVNKGDNEKKIQERQRQTLQYRNYLKGDLTFSCPNTWVEKQGGSRNSFAQFISTTALGSAQIDFSSANFPTLVKMYEHDQQEWPRYWRYLTGLQADQIKFGYGSRLAGINAIFETTDGRGKTVHRVIYFGYPNCVYRIQFDCDKQDYLTLNKDFEHILSSLTCLSKFNNKTAR
jgi:hypothetical protein